MSSFASESWGWVPLALRVSLLVNLWDIFSAVDEIGYLPDFMLTSRSQRRSSPTANSGTSSAQAIFGKAAGSRTGVALLCTVQTPQCHASFTVWVLDIGNARSPLAAGGG